MFFIGLPLLLSSGCAKKQPSIEARFPVFYTLKESCKKQADSSLYVNPYQQVYAPGKSNLPILPVDSVTSVTQLPLDITRDSSVFVFRSDKRSDTLWLAYQRKMATEDRDLTMILTKVKIVKSTFDTIKVKCKNPSHCDDTESLVIYY
jgi:hypothetical protein